MADKASGLKYAGGIWRRVFEEVRSDFTHITSEAKHIDAVAMELIQHPSDFIYKENASWRACFKNDHTQEGRQNFIETWFINGAIYIVDFEHFTKYKKFYSLGSCEIFHMSIENSIDIDSPIDLLMAEGWINEKN